PWPSTDSTLTSHPVGETPSPATSTQTCRPTTSWPTPRSTSKTGPATKKTPAGATGYHRKTTPTTPGSNTSSPNSPQVARPVWLWPTAPAPQITAAKARSVPYWSKPTSCPAWSPSQPSCSDLPASRYAPGFSLRTRPPAPEDPSTVPARCCSSMPATWDTWSTAPNAL